MEIHILQAGKQIGPFSEVQVRQYLGEGRIAPSDLALCEGMENWQSLDLLLANLPPASDRKPEMTSPETTPTEPPAATEPTPDLTPQQTIDDNAPVTADTQSVALPPTDVLLSLTATQRTKKKLNKIVIQPILPLEPTAPTTALRKKTKTGKTAVTLEPLRPTTALPPVTGFAPKEKKPTGKATLRTGQLSFGDFADKSMVNPSAKPEAVPIETAPSEPALAVESTTIPFTTTAPAATDFSAEILRLRPWYQRVPRELFYAGVALTVIVVCVILTFVFLVFSHSSSPPPSVSLSNNAAAPAHVEVAPTDIEPKTADDFSNRGFARQNKGNLESAIEDYEKALSLDPKNVEAHYRHGLALQAKGDTEGALNDYNQAIDLNPNHADAFSNRAYIKQSKNDFDGALADYNRALALNPKISRAYFNEGLIKVQKGNLDGAISDYDHAIDLDPTMAIAFYNRGVAKNTEGNLDGAVADYSQAILLNAKFASAYCARGFARQTKGDADGAMGDYTQALSLNPKLTDAFYNRGLIKMQKGDLNGAVDDNSEAINLDPNNSAAYSNRGLAYFGKGNLEDAATDLKKFCDLAPRDLNADSAQLYLWLISMQRNPKSNADAALSTALNNDWNSPPEDLTSKIAAFLLGHMKESALIANAASPDPSREPAQYCRVWYFAGMKRMLSGDTTTATNYFGKAVGTNQKGICEYVFSQAELKAIAQGREVAAKPAEN